jgi:hypothetical protein
VFRLQADPNTQLQVDQVFTPHGHYINLYVHGPEQLDCLVACHESPAQPVQITRAGNRPPPPLFQQVWPVKTFALRYRINHPTSLDRAADDLRDALQRGRVIVCVEIILRYWQWVDDKTIDIEVIPLPQPVPPPSTMGIGLALATTSLLPSVPTFALPAKPSPTLRRCLSLLSRPLRPPLSSPLSQLLNTMISALIKGASATGQS